MSGEYLELVLDSGSSDTWVIESGYNCADPATCDPSDPYDTCDINDPGFPCYFGRPYNFSSTWSQIPDENFNVTYADNEIVAGLLGHETITLAGITVPSTIIGVATFAAWYGDTISSGLLGMAYPFLTNGYSGDNPADDTGNGYIQYNPVFTTMYSNNLVAPIWSLALNRPPANLSEYESADGPGGLLALGGIPDIPHGTYWANTTIHSLGTSYATGQQVYEYYTITVGGYAVSQDQGAQFNVANVSASSTTHTALLAPQTTAIVDSGTNLIYVPEEVVIDVANSFLPPGYYDNEYQSYMVPCDAVAPLFGVEIAGKIFYVNPRDLVGPPTNYPYCAMGVQPNSGSFNILGDAWLRNVLAVFDVGNGEMRFAAREFVLAPDGQIGDPA
ncbi:hypothetical protein M8818_001357 [Zalaria obscura]|uniref:Uncharacterized protein n=1 Tax=Zalaria obscura TaxID=2024903 RepID=A0ACC3SP31_9PEZI